MEDAFSEFSSEIRDIISRQKKHIEDVVRGKKKVAPTFWRGHRFIPGFEAETAKYAYDDLKVEDGTVFIITYPKTGTNWCTEVVRRIVYGKDEKQYAMHKLLTPFLFDLEMAFAEKFRILEHLPIKRKIFRSHLPEELVNTQKIKHANGKIIIVLRNPKDQAVSWFHFTNAHNHFFDGVREEFSNDWPAFLEYYTSGKQPTISKEGEWYPDHVLGWYKHKDDENVLFVHFEDMKKDIATEIRRIGQFLGEELSDQRVIEIAEATTFSFMKMQIESKQSDVDKLRSQMNLFRKGQVGGWKEMFTVAQAEKIDSLVKEKLEETDIKFKYEI